MTTEAKNEVLDPIDSVNQKVKKQSKKKKQKEKKEPLMKRANFQLKKWFFGLGKEFGRITWLKKNIFFEELLTVIIVCILFALLFFGIDMIIISL